MEHLDFYRALLGQTPLAGGNLLRGSRAGEKQVIQDCLAINR